MRICLFVVLLQSSVGISSSEIPSPSRFSIHDAVASVLVASPQLKQAQAEQNAQKEKKRGAWSDLGPRIKGTYNEVHFRNKLTAPISDRNVVIRNDRTRIADLQIVQPVTGLVALYQNARMQGLGEDLARTKTDIVSSELAFQAAEAWLKAFQSERQLSIAEASILASENQLKDARALERVGRLNRGDVLKLELLLSESQSRAAHARSFRDIAFANLKEISGFAQDANLNLAESIPEALSSDLSSDEALKIALQRRDEMKQAQGAVETSQYGKKIAYSQFSPSINVFAQFERNFGDLTIFGQTDRNTPTYGIQATWDLWNNGSTVFAVREASQRTVQAEEGVRSAEMAIRLDVLSSLSNLRAARESLSLAKLAVQQAEEAYRIEKVKFAAGNSSASDLVLAETAATGSKGRLVSVESDLVSRQLKLQKALGERQPQFKAL